MKDSQLSPNNLSINNLSINDKRGANSPPAHYGRYGNVVLTNEEYDELKTELPDSCERYIEKLSVYMASSGKSYNNHAATILRWADSDKTENEKKEVRNTVKPQFPDYTYEEGESL